ncbi:hypothetical protein EYC80_006987 [Monilinia laxa]|uniref:Uncharacterized protein n=1 Tax=Monilinia laxa TaxID=61186 RepID=A0A5N6JZS7_MONLA|nr:hypothetical protein EYC80_006987 [Monilinia laxa]
MSLGERGLGLHGDVMICAARTAKNRREKKVRKKKVMGGVRSRLGRVFGRVWAVWHDFRRWRREVEECRQRRADKYNHQMVNPDDLWNPVQHKYPQTPNFPLRVRSSDWRSWVVDRQMLLLGKERPQLLIIDTCVIVACQLSCELPHATSPALCLNFQGYQSGSRRTVWRQNQVLELALSGNTRKHNHMLAFARCGYRAESGEGRRVLRNELLMHLG